MTGDVVSLSVERSALVLSPDDFRGWERWAEEQARKAAESHGYEWWPPTTPPDPSKPYPLTMRHVGRLVSSGREKMAC